MTNPATCGLTADVLVTVLLARFVSPPSDTVELLTMLAAALLATLKVIAIGGKLAPLSKVSLRTQVKALRLQLQPAPTIAVAVNPAPKVLATVIVPLVATEPTLETTTVEVAPLAPCRRFPVCVALTVKS